MSHCHEYDNMTQSNTWTLNLNGYQNTMERTAGPSEFLWILAVFSAHEGVLKNKAVRQSLSKGDVNY